MQLVVLRKLVPTISAHDSALAGHFADKRTYKRIKGLYFWSGISVDVRQWCRSCDVCFAHKVKPTRPHHAMQTDEVSEPVQRVALDILGPLNPPTSAGIRYILMVVDYLTKWAEAFPMPDQTAE